MCIYGTLYSHTSTKTQNNFSHGQSNKKGEIYVTVTSKGIIFYVIAINETEILISEIENDYGYNYLLNILYD